MDQSKYTTLVEVLTTLMDPHKARGKRYGWMLLLTLIASAIASGQRTVHAIADWIALHWEDLQTELHPMRTTCPSESTFRRALRLIDPQGIEELLTHLDTKPSPLPPVRAVAPPRLTPVPLQAQAVDGKELRGALAHGEKVQLVSLVRHADAITLAQTAVEQKSNEIPAVPQLLAGQNLIGTVTTRDALLTQRPLAQQIRHQGGHYFMVVKANQPELYQAIVLLFARPPWTKQEQACEYDVYSRENQGHGRIEQRTLESSTALCRYADWPDVGQVMRRTCRRIIRKTGVVSEKVT